MSSSLIAVLIDHCFSVASARAHSESAHAIASRVGTAVSKWRDEAKRHGLKQAEIDRMASTFEHEELKAALAGR